MKERLDGLFCYLDGQADADGVWGVYVPEDFRITKVSSFLTAGNAGTATTIDIQDDGADAITGVDIHSAGLTTLTTAVELAAGSVVEIDLNLSGGTAPTMTGEIVLWGYWGE